MPWLTKPKNHMFKWSRDAVFEESKKYNSRYDFKKNAGGAYNVACKNNWLDEMVWLDIKEDMYVDKKDNVYSYEYTEFKAVYVGRTNNIKRRHYQHKCGVDLKKKKKHNDSVYKFAKEHNIDVPEMKILETNITPLEGRELEDVWRQRYKEAGWKILNIAKTGKQCGSLGLINSNKWNKSSIKKESLKYHSRNEFKHKSASAYGAALRLKMMDELFPVVKKRKKQSKWTREKCYEAAQNFNTLKDFNKRCSYVYKIARANGWLSEYTWLYQRKMVTYEMCYEIAKKYTSKGEMLKNESNAYYAAYRHGWLSDYTWFNNKNK